MTISYLEFCSRKHFRKRCQ